MKILTTLILVMITFFCPSCENKSQSLDKRIEGNWRQNNRDFTFRSGAMVVTVNSYVFASYQIIDNETMRFRANNNNSGYPIDLMLTVKFPNPNSMIWYRRESGNLAVWMTFQRLDQ